MKTRFVAALAALLCLGGNAAFASTSANADRTSCPTKSPYYGRTDGICYDTGNKAPLVVVDGFTERPLSYSLYGHVFEDFMGATVIPLNGALDAAQGPWTIKDTSAAGTPTEAILGDADNGQLKLAFDATAEVQVLTLYWNDEQNIDSDQEPVVIFRLQLDQTLNANSILTFGLASAQNNTADSVTYNAWFRLSGSNALNLESDDNTTDTDDKDPSLTLAASTMYEFMVCANSICGGSISDIRFFYRATLGGDWTALTVPGVTFKTGADQALQPWLQFQKGANAETDSMEIDYVNTFWNRN